MKVERTKTGNIKIVISLQQAISLEKIIGNMSHTEIVNAVHNRNPKISIGHSDTQILLTLWNKLDDELIGYYA